MTQPLINGDSPNASGQPIGGEVFKTCPMCTQLWSSRTHFLSDQLVELIGYQVNFKNIGEGLFLFTHYAPGCMTTMGIPVAKFMDLYMGPLHPEKRAFYSDCPRYCAQVDNLERCTVLCEYAFVREVMQIIRGHQPG